jgi:hypothetical protein
MMLKPFVVLASILLIAVSVGCLEQAHTNAPLTTSAATTTLKINAPLNVNQSEYATFTCQLNVTHGQGLDNKAIRWSIDNVDKKTTSTIWGYAALNLTLSETQSLSIGKHVLTASFDGDPDYTASHATTTFQVQRAPTPTPSASPKPETQKASVTLSVPATVQRGYADLTGTFSGMERNAHLYVLVRPTGNSTWIVQDVPLIYVNGTYADHVYFDTHGNNNSQQFDLLAVITSNTLNAGDSIKNLPKTLAQNQVTTTVQ